MPFLLRVILTAMQNQLKSVYIPSTCLYCRPSGDGPLGMIGSRSEEADGGSWKSAFRGGLVRLASATFCKETGQASLDSLATARGLWLSSRWTGREPQPVGQMNAMSALVADGVQVFEQQRAKI